MSSVSGSVSKGEKAKSKYVALDINNLYKGKSLENPKTSVLPKHGLQSLGKVGAGRRMPPPANLPSLKSENSGNLNINLVPSGGQGWGSSVKEKVKSEESQASSHSQPQPTSAGSQTSSQTSQANSKPTSTQGRPQPPAVSSNSSTTTTAPPTTGKTWSTITSNQEAGGREPTYLGHQSPYFRQEFPKLAGGNAPTTEMRKSAPDYTPGPSLRPQTEGSWGRGAIQPSGPSPATASQAPNSGSGVNGPICSTEPLSRGTPPLFRNNPSYINNRNFSSGFSNTNYSGMTSKPSYSFSEASNGRNRPQRQVDEDQRPALIIKDKDLKGFDRLLQNDNQDAGWSAPHEEIDYNAKLVFSDDEDGPQNKDSRLETSRCLASSKLLPGKERKEDEAKVKSWNKDKPLNKYMERHTDVSLKPYSDKEENRSQQHSWKNWNAPPPVVEKQHSLEISSHSSQIRHWPNTHQRVPFDYRGPKPATTSYPSTNNNLRGNSSYPLSPHGTCKAKDADDDVWQDHASPSPPAPCSQQNNHLPESHVASPDVPSHQPAHCKKEEDFVPPLPVDKQSPFETSPSPMPTPPSHLIDQDKVKEVSSANEERILVRSRHSSESREEPKHIKDGVTHIAPNNQGFFSKQFQKNVPPRFQKQQEQLFRQQQFQSPPTYPHHPQQPMMISPLNFDSRWSSPPGPPNIESFHRWNTPEDYERSVPHPKNYDKGLEKDVSKENYESNLILNNSNRIISRKETTERIEEKQPVTTSKNSLSNFYEESPKNWDQPETINEKPLIGKKEGPYQEKRIDWSDTPYPIEPATTSFKQRHYLHPTSVEWNSAPHRPMPITQSQLESLAPTKKNYIPLRRTGRPAATLTNLERKPEPKKEEALESKNRQHILDKSSHINWSTSADNALTSSQKSGEMPDKSTRLEDHEINVKSKEALALPETSNTATVEHNVETKKNEQFAQRKHPIDGRERRSRGRGGGNNSYNYDSNNSRGGPQGGQQGYRGKSREYRRSRTDPKGPRFDRQRDHDLVKNDKRNSYPEYNNISHKLSEEKSENMQRDSSKDKLDKQEKNESKNKEVNEAINEKSENAKRDDSKITQSPFEKNPKDNSFSPKGNDRKGTKGGTLSFRRGGGSRRVSNRYGPPSKAPFNYRRSPKQEEGKSEDSSKENRNSIQNNENSGDCIAQQISKEKRHSDRPPHRKANRYDSLPPRLQKRQVNRSEIDPHYRNRGNRNNYPSNSNINHKESDAANEEWETASESSDIAERKERKRNIKDEGRLKSDMQEKNTLKKNNFSNYSIENKYISNNNRNPRSSDFREGLNRSNNFRGRGKKNMNDGVPNGRTNDKNSKNSYKNNEQSQKSNFSGKSNSTPTTLYRVNEFNLEDPNNIQAALSDLTNRKAKNDSSLAKITKPDKTNNLKGYDLNNYAGVVIIDDRPEDVGGEVSHGDQDDGFQEVTSKKRHKLIAENDIKKSKREHQPSQQHNGKGSKSGSWPRQNKLPPRLAKQRENSNKATFVLNQATTAPPIFETEIRPVQIKDSSPPMVNAWEKPISLKSSSQPLPPKSALVTSGTMGLGSTTTGSSSSKSSSFDQHDSGIDVGSDQPASTTSSQRSSPSNDGKGATTAADNIHDLSAEIDTEKPMCTVIFENKNFKAENAVLDKFGASHGKVSSKEGHNAEIASNIPSSFPEDKKTISSYPPVSSSDSFSKGDKPNEVKLDFASLESDLNQLSNSNLMAHPTSKQTDNIPSEEISLASVKKPCYKVWDGLPLVLEHTSGGSNVASASESTYHPTNASLPEYSSDTSQGIHKEPTGMIIVDSDAQSFGSGGSGLKSSGLVAATANVTENNGAKLKTGGRSPPPVPVQLSSPPPVLFNSQQQQQAYPQRPFHQQYTAYTAGSFNQQTSLYMTQQELYSSTQFRPYTQTAQHSAPVLNTQATNPHLLGSQLVQSRPSHLTSLPAAAASSFYSSSGQNFFHQPASNNYPPNQQSFGSHNILPPTAQNFRNYGNHPQFKPVLTPEPSSPTIHDSLAMFQSNSNSQLVKQPAPAPKATPAAYYPFSQSAAAKFGPPTVRPVLYPVQRPPPQTPQFVTANPSPYPTPIQRPATAGLLPPPPTAAAATKLVAPSKISSAQQAQQRAEAIQQAELFFTRPEKNASMDPSVSSEDKPHIMTSRAAVESTPTSVEEAAIEASPSSLDASQVED